MKSEKLPHQLKLWKCISALCAVFMLAALGIVSVHVSAFACDKKPKVEVLDLPGTQIKVDSATVSDIDNIPVLSYSVTNKTAEPIIVSDLFLLVLDQQGNIKLGQGWRESTTIESFSSKAFSTKLQTKIAEGDRTVLTVERTRTSYGRIETPDLVESIKQYVKGKLTAFPTVPRNLAAGTNARLNKAAFTVPMNGDSSTYCADAQKTAASACRCGLASFSCTENTGYSFSCFQCPATPPGGGGDKQPIQP